MPQGDSPDQPLVMTPIQFIRPSPLIMGASAVDPDSQDSGEGDNNMIQGLIMRLERLESSNMALRTEVRELTHRVAKIEEEPFTKEATR
jgi:hypothetical protein